MKYKTTALFLGMLILLLMPMEGCKAEKPADAGKGEDKMTEKHTPIGESEYVREPAVAGQFYEGNPERLRKAVKKYLDGAPVTPCRERIIGLMEPHAGYVYSGPVAGFGYRLVEGKKYNTVIVLAPSHHLGFSGVSIIMQGKYRTPLGDVPIDSELARKIAEFNPEKIRYIPQAHSREHSLEVQVPFLQVALQKGWKIVPIVFGSPSLETCRMIGSAISPHYDPETQLIVASTDMSHFHPYEKACAMDKPALEYVKNLDVTGLIEDVEAGRAEYCGIGPVLTLMMFTRSLGGEAKILKYANSGDTAGDKSRVVGYGCAVFTIDENTGVAEKLEKDEFKVSDEEKKALLEMARKTLEEKLIHNRDVTFDQPGRLLDQKLGLFVTLRKGKEHHLRGCIGHVFPVKQLRYALPELALSSALSDPRFPSVRKEELKDINIEISLLSPMKRITNPDEIRIPGHGVYVKKDFRSGVFLPQVADETGWDRETFMAHLCRDKAGLPADQWKKPDTELYIFTATIFNEE